MDGPQTPSSTKPVNKKIASFTMMLGVRGESVDEIVDMACNARQLARPVPFHDNDNVVDTCGTGGNGGGIFNISAATAIVTAACGAFNLCYVWTLSEPGLAVIAEMKPRIPLRGALTECYRPAALAHAHQCGGAAAISVLTHEEGFGGSPEHLAILRAEVSHAPEEAVRELRLA